MKLTKLQEFVLYGINESIDNKFLPPLTEDLKLELIDRIINNWNLWETYNDIILDIYFEFIEEKGLSNDKPAVKPIYFENK